MRLETQRFDQYHLIRLLKRGGMGEIYLAEDEKLNRQVAIKVIRTDIVTYVDDDEARAAAKLFLQEARVVAKLDHQHILPLFDADEAEVDGVTLLYMVMPLREEGSFAEWLHKYGPGRPLSPQYVERIVKQAASALQHAHDNEIIHLDVKPSNFLIRDSAQHPRQLYLQLADFGIARLMTTTSHSHIIRGTPSHMAPEQWKGKAVPASDQYALGVMAYELLTGQPPFQGTDQQNMWFQHASITPERPSLLNPNIPTGLDAVLLRALAKMPQARYSSVTAFALAFQKVLRDTGNIRQQLVISEAEAHAGTRRIINVTGRRQLTVDIPPGVQNGQVLYFEGQGGNPMYGGSPGALILTIAIAHTQNVITLADTGHLSQTAVAPHPQPTFNYEELPPDPRRPGSKHILRTILLLSIVFIVILGSVIALTLINPHSPNITTAKIPEPTPNRTVSVRANATTRAQTSATAGEHATVTAVTVQSNATATAITAQSNATATAIARQHATAATATAIVTATIGAYNAMGNAAALDPLQDNSQGHQWDTNYQSNAGGCEFLNQAYHSVVLKVGSGFYSPCYAESTNSANFFYEVQSQIVQGDEAGILFRGNSTNGTFYCFHIDASGAYGLDIYESNNTVTPTQANGTNSYINTASGATNLLAVRAHGNILELFVNKHLIASITDNTYTSGQIGVFAASQTKDTDVMFSNVRFGNI